MPRTIETSTARAAEATGPGDIIVYSKPLCVQCTATIRRLTKLGARFHVIDLTADEDALNHARALGYTQAPIVLAGERHWSGFNPDAIANATREQQKTRP